MAPGWWLVLGGCWSVLVAGGGELLKNNSMSVRRVVVCEAQVPFVRGGAELLVRELVTRLQLAGYAAELVSVPFKWYPKQEILAHAAAWRLLDLSESNGRPIDVVIGTKFPTYFVRHPKKVTWLIHQYRAAYELCGTCYGDFGHEELDVGLRQRLLTLDRQMLGESQRVFTIARTVSARLQRYNDVRAEPLLHPPRLAGQLVAGAYSDYVLVVGRIESIKRVDLVVRAMHHVSPGVRLVVIGEGTQRKNVERVAAEIGVTSKVTFLGAVTDDVLIRAYAEALAVCYVPFDEDLGYVTLEAFLARRPVVTTTDSGGPLEFVEDGVNGWVCEPSAEAIGEALDALAADRAHAASLGEAGYDKARRISWEGVVERLVGGL
jgi:glycosyltransferase involved in cell wall biosynthesis